MTRQPLIIRRFLPALWTGPHLNAAVGLNYTFILKCMSGQIDKLGKTGLNELDLINLMVTNLFFKHCYFAHWCRRMHESLNVLLFAVLFLS